MVKPPSLMIVRESLFTGVESSAGRQIRSALGAKGLDCTLQN